MKTRKLTTRSMVMSVLLDATETQKAGHWYKQHSKAVNLPTAKESGILGLLLAAADYIDRFDFGQSISEDYLASEYFEPILGAISNLLNYETGRLDGGKMSEAVGYLRSQIDNAANEVGTQPDKASLSRYADLAARMNGRVAS